MLDEYDTPMQEAYLYGYWKNLQHLSEVYLMQRLRQIHIWKSNDDRDYTRVEKNLYFQI